MTTKPIKGDKVKQIVEAIQEYYYNHDTPPPKYVTVDVKGIRGLEEKSIYCATVTTEVEYISRSPKKHTARICFVLDKYNRINPKTVRFLVK